MADRLGDVLNSAESDLRVEQAVYGLDAKDERDLQSVLAEGLEHHLFLGRVYGKVRS